MQSQHTPQNRVRRTVNDLVMVEMFLVQATIESATAIGNGLSELGKQLNKRDDNNEGWRQSITEVLYRIADDAVEPYSSRYKYFRDMITAED